MKSIQQQADEVVEKFTSTKIECEQYSVNCMYLVEKNTTHKNISQYTATCLAIIHVEGILMELSVFKNSDYGEARIKRHTEILTELKSRI